MGDTSTTPNTPQAAVAASNKWKQYLANQAQQQSGGVTLNLPTIDGFGGGQVQIGAPNSTLGQVPVSQRPLGGIVSGGLYGGNNTSINVLS
jgi:hypothetical protein